MAKKRMFSLSVVDTDLFLEMPVTSRLLYYELGMRADDDGFVGNWRKIMRMTNLNEDDMKVLIAKKFIIPFESGVIVITHWRLNNYLQRDRTTETVYKEELAQLNLNDNVYSLKNVDNSRLLEDGKEMYTECIQNVYTDKIRLDKTRLDKSERKAPTLEEVQAYIDEKHYNVNAKTFIDYYETNNWTDSNNKKVRNWKQKIITWHNHYQKPKETIDNRVHENKNVDWNKFITNL